jgi:CHAD domain-containing protein
MSFRLSIKESVSEGLKRLVLGEIDSAAKQLDSVNQRDPGRAIHAARVSIKKIRSVIRLVRHDLGHAFKKRDRRLRDLGRELAAIRDSAALVNTIDSLSVGAGGSSAKKAGLVLRRQLMKQKRRIEHASGTRRTMAKVADTLRAFGEKVEARPLDSLGFAAVARGLCNGFGAAREAMNAAIHRPSAQNYHQWRKRVKNHWYDLQLVERYWNDAMRTRARTLSELQARLGDYHDLTLFQIRLKSMRAKAENSGDTSILLARAADSQKKLRARCLLLGHRLFDEAPEEFAQDVSELGPRREADR